ncbi:hypothetical protein J6590_044119 [Homalodisca vitripennis]|nr:hypothetical protein J6590_044119 [Homalodisca vitripennis]
MSLIRHNYNPTRAFLATDVLPTLTSGEKRKTSLEIASKFLLRSPETKIPGPDDRGGRRGYSLNRDCVNGRVNGILSYHYQLLVKSRGNTAWYLIVYQQLNRGCECTEYSEVFCDIRIPTGLAPAGHLLLALQWYYIFISDQIVILPCPSSSSTTLVIYCTLDTATKQGPVNTSYEAEHLIRLNGDFSRIVQQLLVAGRAVLTQLLTADVFGVRLIHHGIIRTHCHRHCRCHGLSSSPPHCQYSEVPPPNSTIHPHSRDIQIRSLAVNHPRNSLPTLLFRKGAL